MASLTPDQAASAAKSAADAATSAASAAQEAAAAARIYADQAAGGLGDMAGAMAHAVSGGAIDPFVFRLSVFVLAIFVGYYVVWQVTPALHTPLMSVTNAISSVIVVGALLAVGVDAAVDAAAASGHAWAQGFGFVALVLASVNIFGGFLVTSRMLAMYKKKTK